jgi:hypothetical protein
MKSFTSHSFSTTQPTLPASVIEDLKTDPLTLFTDFQWFLYQGRDTVFFTAFTHRSYERDDLRAMVREMVRLAPQLTHGFAGANPGLPLSDAQIDAVISVADVDTLDGLPDSWIGTSADVFDVPGVPMFRLMAANLSTGPDGQGRAGALQVRAAHCLLEGSDSALLTRSQPAGHGLLKNQQNKVGLLHRIGGMLGAFSMTSIHLFFAHLLSPPEKKLHPRTLAISRRRLRDLALKLGVRQRALYFALVGYALNGPGPNKVLSDKAISAAYTMIGGLRNDADDDFFRVRTLEAKFAYSEDFVTFVEGVDRTVAKIEERDVSKLQMAILAMFGMHRKLHKFAPWIHGPRFWRFSGSMHMVLTLVPPHRINGALTQGMVEPIYCGAFHPSVNICTFCPGREYVTFNFTVEEKLAAGVQRIEPLIEALEAQFPSPATDRPAATAAT